MADAEQARGDPPRHRLPELVLQRRAHRRDIAIARQLAPDTAQPHDVLKQPQLAIDHAHDTAIYQEE